MTTNTPQNHSAIHVSAFSGVRVEGLDLDAIEGKWLQQCGPCDGGLPMGCTHPTDDYRPVIADLVAALRERDNTITRVREVLDEMTEHCSPVSNGFFYEVKLRAALDPQETP